VLFTEPTFLFLFLPALLAAYFAPLSLEHGRWGNWALLAASVVFYAKGGGAFTWLVLGSIAFNWAAAIGVDRARGTPAGHRRLTLSVAANLAVLGVFKYTTFFAENLSAAWQALGGHALTVPALVQPLGISFFTFRAVSYLVDASRKGTVARSPLQAALYLLLFPLMVAGPITPYRELADQIARRRVGSADFAEGVRRFVIGLGKKLLIANTVGGPADRIFALPTGQWDSSLAWLAVICYTLQVYFDFSGYSDMAIGLGRMLGFRIPENFRHPYAARSVAEFWRRWHISLSTWFRDYVFLPIAYSSARRLDRFGWSARAQTEAAYLLATVSTMFLCGLWHGAGWPFVVWGLYHGTFLVLERLGLAAWLSRRWAPLGHAYLILVVVVGWAFFRAQTLHESGRLLAAMAGLGPARPSPYALGFFLTPEVTLALVAGVIGATPVAAALGRWRDGVASGGPGSPLGWALDAAGTLAVIAVLLAAVLQVAAATYNPFIYYRF
jgi:alginate O-acetyltransferase complex protein AlgI